MGHKKLVNVTQGIWQSDGKGMTITGGRVIPLICAHTVHAGSLIRSSTGREAQTGERWCTFY